MRKNLVKIIALVLVLAIAISTFAITSIASSEVTNAVNAVSSFLGKDLTKGDVADLLGGVDVSTVIDVVKDIAKADVEDDDLTSTISDVVADLTDQDSLTLDPNAIVDAVKDAATNSSAINVSDLTDLINSVTKSNEDSSTIGDILGAITGSLDLGKVVEGNTSDVLSTVVDVAKGALNAADIAVGSSTVKSSDGFIGAWSTSMVKAALSLSENSISLPLSSVTARTRIQMTTSGDTIRLRLSNFFGTSPMSVGEVTVALGNDSLERGVKLDTMKKATVNGATSFTIPAGQEVYTDPIDLSVGQCEDLVVSVYYENVNTFSTVGLIGGHTYVSIGNNTEDYVTPASIDFAIEDISVGAFEIIPCLAGVDVYKPDGRSVVIFGDSTLTNTITPKLAAMAKANGIDDTGLLLQAIKGNEVLADPVGTVGTLFGERAAVRFYRDAIDQPGVDTILIKIGVNDIAHRACQSKHDDYDDWDTFNFYNYCMQLLDGYKELIDAAKAKGIHVIMVTRSPADEYVRDMGTGPDIDWDADYDGYTLKELRNRINTELKTWDDNGYVDAVIDFDALSDASVRASFGLEGGDPEAMFKGATLPDGTVIPSYNRDGAHLTEAGCDAAARLFYPYIFGDSKVAYDDIDLSDTVSYGGIDNTIGKIKDALGIESELDLGSLLTKIQDIKGLINKVKPILNALKGVTGEGEATETDLTSALDLLGLDKQDFAGTDVLNKLLDLVNSKTESQDITTSELEKIFSDKNLDTDAILDAVKDKAEELLGGSGIDLSDVKLPEGLDMSNLDTNSIADFIKNLVDSKADGKDKDVAAAEITRVLENGTAIASNPAIEPLIEEVESEVDVITDILVDQNDVTPLASLDDTTALATVDSEEIANTGDIVPVAFATITVLAGAAYVASRKVNG